MTVKLKTREGQYVFGFDRRTGSVTFTESGETAPHWTSYEHYVRFMAARNIAIPCLTLIEEPSSLEYKPKRKKRR